MTLRGLKMTKVTILLYANVSAAQVSGFIDLFRFANDLWQYQHPGASALYHTQLADLTGQTQYHTGSLSFHCLPAIPCDTDILLIPGSYAHEPTSLVQIIELFAAHKLQFQQIQQLGGLIGASCNGTFALAATGLLDKQCATTCWFLVDYFKRSFPQVLLKPELAVVQSSQFCTAGATTSYIQLGLLMVQIQQGAVFSQQLAKLMVTESAITQQAPFLSVQQLVPHQDLQISEVQQFLRRNYADELVLAEIADKFAMSERTLIRRFKQATGDTPMAWLQKLRVDKAKQLLETTLLPIDDLPHAVGYADLSSFRKLFQQYTSLSPKVYRERFYLR
jgi:transcriptional regulator GlxA family with amidase domain